MKTLINKSNEEIYIHKNILNNIRFAKPKTELTRNYNASMIFSDKSKSNFSENVSYKKIKKIKNILSKNKFYQKDISSRDSSYPLCLSSMINSKNYLKSINIKLKMKNNSNIKDNKAISDNHPIIKSYKNLEYKNYRNKEVNFNRKFEINKFPKANGYNDHNNNSIQIKNSYSKFNPSRNLINFKLIENYESKSLNIRNFMNKRVFNIYEPKKIIENKISEDNKIVLIDNDNNKEIRITRINPTKKRLQNILQNKIKSTIDIEPSINQKELVINDSLKKSKFHNNNSSTIINDSKKIIPKILKKSINSINNKGKVINTNKEKLKTINIGKPYENKNNVINTVISLSNEKNNKNEDTNKLIQAQKNLNLMKATKMSKKKKIKIMNIIPKKERKINEINKNFLKEISIVNDNDSKDFKLIKNIKINKIKMLFNQKRDNDEIISKSSENLKSYNYSFGQKLNLNEMKGLYKDIMKIDKSTYSELLKESVKDILLNSYIKHIIKCSMDNILTSYIYANVDFSSIYLPEIKIRDKKSSLLIADKLFSIKKKNTIFQDEKSKFIESKKIKKSFQIFSSYFIKRDLYIYGTNSTNYNYLDTEYFSKFGKKENLKDSHSLKHKSLSIKKLTSIKSRKSSFYSPTSTFRKSSYNVKELAPNLSLLGKSKFFEVSQRHLKNNLKYSLYNNFLLYKIKKDQKKGISYDDISITNKVNKSYIKKIIELISEKKIKKDESRHAFYLKLLNNIKGRENIHIILNNLIKQGEESLFQAYFNNYIRIININSIDEDGNTFLILSIKRGLYSITKMLLENGINVNIQNNKGNSALHYALSGKNFEMADILKKYGAKEDCINKLGFTPWECIGKFIDETY